MNFIVSIIPARGGSKGIVDKNIRLLGSKPLIVHTIQDSLSSRYVSYTFITTDSLEIAKVSKMSGASVISRPSQLASDISSSESALIHALQAIEHQYGEPDLIVFLQCTSPIRTGRDIDQAIEKIYSENADSLLSVSPSHRFLWHQIDGVAKSINYDYRHRKRRQDMNPQYVENGSIYIFKPWVLKELGNRLGGKISLFPMSEAAAHEIDSPLDFEIAEFLLKHQATSHAN